MKNIYNSKDEKQYDFIDEGAIFSHLTENKKPDSLFIKDIIQKSLEINMLSPNETAALLHVKDLELLEEMKVAASTIKNHVYDNRIVTFAPLYMSNKCINNCLYCAFRKDNDKMVRKVLSMDEVRAETEVLAGHLGHKRLIVVFGEHPESNVDYMKKTIETIYSVKAKTKKGYGQIRRVNVNAAPLSIDDLKILKESGIGTYQVFQETYHHKTYNQVHPAGTLKNDYLWRLFSMHRAFEAGIDDVGIGALFGLYNWQFEVMGLIYHSIELEKRFGVGPHTISFPRLEVADNSPYTQSPEYEVSDDNFKKALLAIRLSVPHTGMILTARETEELRREVLPFGITQTDASTKIGLGSYSENPDSQQQEKQQFVLGDTRSLDEVIFEFAKKGIITSFCTAGYRCGRTGECIMDMLKDGKESKFCKLNAILTFREWLDDFASEKTLLEGEKVIQKEINEVASKMPESYNSLMKYYKRVKNGERDLYF